MVTLLPEEYNELTFLLTRAKAPAGLFNAAAAAITDIWLINDLLSLFIGFIIEHKYIK
jgi:hypothetical protein